MADPQQLNEWLTQTARGNRRSFAALYAATSGQLFAVLLRVLNRRDWAEEALQDCYVRIWQKAGTYDASKSAPMTWMVTVARHRALDLLRMRRPEYELPQNEAQESIDDLPQMVDEREDPEARASEQQNVERLLESLKSMPAEHRRALMLALYEGYTHEELSLIMNLPLGTVKTWIRRALARLRADLRHEG